MVGFKNMLLTFIILVALAPTPSLAFGDDVGKNAAIEIAGAMDRATDKLQLMADKFSGDLSGQIAEIRKLALESLRQIDLITENRLKEVDKMRVDTLNRIDILVNSAVDKLNDTITCVPASVADAIKHLADNTHLLGLNINYKSIEGQNDYIQYKAARDEILAALAKVDDNSHGDDIMSLYDEIAVLATTTQCHYLKRDTGRVLLDEAVAYSNDAHSWYLAIRR